MSDFQKELDEKLNSITFDNEFEDLYQTIIDEIVAARKMRGLSQSELSKTIYLPKNLRLNFYLNTQSAFAIGLLPPDLGRNIESIGNSALHAACVCLADDSKLETARQIASACTVIELNLSPVFNEAFIDNMLFGSEEDEE